MKWKRLVLLASITLLHGLAYARPVESYYFESYERMSLFIRETLAVEGAALTPAEQMALVNVQSAIDLKKELPAKQALDFSWPASKFQRREDSCPVSKIAITNWTTGSPIYLNRAIFYEGDEITQLIDRALEGSIIGARDSAKVSFAEAVQTIFHELGHHHGYADHHWLNTLGGKVGKAAVALIQRESGNIDRYLSQRANQLPAADAFVDLSLFDHLGKKVRREEVSGTFYTLSIGTGEGEKGRLYFLPNGEERGLVVGIAPQAPRAALRKVLNEVGEGFPFRGSIEKVYVGRSVRTKDSLVLVPSDEPDYVAVSNLWAAPEPRKYLEDAIVGKIFLSTKDEIYLDLRGYTDRRKFGDFIFLELPDPNIRRRVVASLRENLPRSAAIVFQMDPVEKRAQGWVARVPTVVYFRE